MITLRVMTFNIRGSHHRDGANAWKRRASLSARVIQRCAPDLIGFQEFQAGNSRFYEAHLPEYERALGPEYENRPPRSHNAIFWNPQRLELLSTGGFWLSKTPEVFSGSWGTHQKRSANWARFRTARNGTEFVHLNTHLDHKSVAARRQGARLLVRRIDELAEGKLPALVTGDFNADPDSAVYRIFTGAGFEDAHRLAGETPARTFHKFQGEGFVSRRPEKEGRIDWVLVRGAGSELQPRKTSCRVVRDAEPPVYPSDHYPVFADLELESTAAPGHLTQI
ncbi:MAG: endonuclease/exonuclease/phosphatase family protein [Actinomycetota bacterium]|nr:endonuclease/exonuclease/phosphatase family protein [Actinomycetota bacterium]HZY65162.1 endonuclease/exonuclease/phosphatase family protein [Rubrobacteraceae bacterium]